MSEGIVEGNISYPLEYKVRRVGDILALPLKEGQARVFKRVVKRTKYHPKIRMDATNWLMAADAAEYKAQKITDDGWLRMYDDVLGVFCIAVGSDREIEVRLYNPATMQRHGIKNDDDTFITPEISPIDSATAITYSWGDSYIPNFRLTNPTEYTPVYVFVQAYGHTYLMEDARDTSGKKFTDKYLPRAFEPVTMRTVVGGGD